MRTELNHKDNDSAIHRSPLIPEGAVCMNGHSNSTWNEGINVIEWKLTIPVVSNLISCCCFPRNIIFVENEKGEEKESLKKY